MKRNKEINPGILKDKLDKELMLEQLATEISRRFKIEKEEAISLIKNNTLEGLDSLKKQIKIGGSKNLENLNNSELEKLFLTLKGAQEVIKNYSEIEIMILKEDVEQSINIGDFVNILENSLPKKLVEKAKDPKNLHEHVLGFALGTANSAFAIIDMLYQIGAGIVKAPYHLYLIISGKGEIEGVENI